MKKSYWILVILGIVAIAAGLFFFSQQRIARYYTITSTANEPGLRLHSKYLTSSLITPEKLDFVVFNFKHEITGDGQWVYRLIAEAGDTLQIKDAITYVNGVNTDASLKLKHSYILSEKEFHIVEKSNLHHESYLIAKNQYLAHLPDSFALSKNFSSTKKNINQVDDSILKKYSEPWNKDEFGPYIIPEGAFFVMGDNRHNALDSRYIGVIQVSEIVGVIIKK